MTFSQEKDQEAVQAKILTHIIKYLADPEPFVRAEASRMMERLVALTDNDLDKLLEAEKPTLKKMLIDGFINFPTMTAFAQHGFLDFVSNYLVHAELYDWDYLKSSMAFISNLELILWNTDVALNSMPSCRYTATNLSRGSHSLEAQMKTIREQSFNALKAHNKVLIILKTRIGKKMSTSERDLERLAAAIQAIDLKRLRQQEGEDIKAYLEHVYTLAGLESDNNEEDMDVDVESQLESLKKRLDKLSKELKNKIDTKENDQKVLINSHLDEMVKFLLKLTVHEGHPYRQEAKALVKEVSINS